MTTGSRGVHVVVSLDRSQDFDEVRDFARQVADALAEEHPDAPTTAPRKKDRGDRLFLAPAVDARHWTVENAVERARTDPWDGLLGRGRSLGPAWSKLRSR